MSEIDEMMQAKDYLVTPNGSVAYSRYFKFDELSLKDKIAGLGTMLILLGARPLKVNNGVAFVAIDKANNAGEIFNLSPNALRNEAVCSQLVNHIEETFGVKAVNEQGEFEGIFNAQQALVERFNESGKNDVDHMFKIGLPEPSRDWAHVMEQINTTRKDGGEPFSIYDALSSINEDEIGLSQALMTRITEAYLLDSEMSNCRIENRENINLAAYSPNGLQDDEEAFFSEPGQVLGDILARINEVNSRAISLYRQAEDEKDV